MLSFSELGFGIGLESCNCAIPYAKGPHALVKSCTRPLCPELRPDYGPLLAA